MIMTAYLSPKVAPFPNLERKFIRFPSSFLLSAATASADMAEVGRIKRGIVSPRVDRKVNTGSVGYSDTLGTREKCHSIQLSL